LKLVLFRVAVSYDESHDAIDLIRKLWNLGGRDRFGFMSQQRFVLVLRFKGDFDLVLFQTESVQF
jgi:hypothetical protein